MIRSLALPLVILLGAALAACSNTVSSLQYTAAPGMPAAPTPASPGDATIGAITSIDKRKERPTQLATVMGGFGNPLKTLETSKPVKDEVADAFALGLRARGLMVAAGQAPFALRLTVPEFNADMMIGRQARITVTLEVLDRAGAAIYTDTVSDKQSDMKFMETGIFANINDLKLLCETVLARTVDTMLGKPAFRTAVAGDPNNPIRAAALPTPPRAQPTRVPAAPPMTSSAVPIDSDVSGVFELAGMQVPLLDGTWTVAGTGSGGTSSAASLVRIEQGKLWGIIRAWHGTRSSGGGYAAFGPCNRTDILFTTTTTNVDRGDQDCWTINHTLLAQSRAEQKEPHQTQAYAFLDERGVSVGEGLALISSIHRVATPTGYVSVWYQVNPEFFGFAPSNAAAWRDSEWHRARIAADPKRVAFVESFKNLNAQYQDHVKAGFQRQLGAFTPKTLTLADAAPAPIRLARD